MEKSTSITKLAGALVGFSKDMDKIKKDSDNTFFKSKYASLSQIQDDIQLPLSKAGLIYTQHPETNNILTTILIHVESGEYMQSGFDIHPIPEYSTEKDKDKKVLWRSEQSHISPQALGSAITYAKRYALVAILGLNIDDDDDGNAASGRQETNSKPAQQVDKRPELLPNTTEWTNAVKYLAKPGTSLVNIEAGYKLSSTNKEKLLTQSQEVFAS